MVFTQSGGFLLDDLIQIRTDWRIHTKSGFVQNDHVSLGERAHGKFTVPGMPDFADDKNIQWALENIRHLCGYNHPATRQAENPIGFHASTLQVASQPPAGILA